MTLPETTLDTRTFQSLVTEARARVAARCPEWTEHNVSDPGITLIETFAWMTEMLIYRVNQLPDRAHVALLRLLDITLAPPTAANAEVRFRISGPEALPLTISAKTTEITTSSAEDDPVVFRPRANFEIKSMRPVAYALGRAPSEPQLATVDPDGIARPQGDDQLAFSSPRPRVGDAFYLGFNRPLDRLVMRVEVKGSQAQGFGISPDSPPLRWEAWTPHGWSEANVIEDTTAGFNLSEGHVDLQLPRRTRDVRIGGEDWYWLRCRVMRPAQDGPRLPRYDAPPRLASITAYPVGALVRVEHATSVTEELLGESDQTPGQCFTLRNVPALTPDKAEYLEVQAPGEPQWRRWELRESFEDSRPDDKHYRFDAASGEVELGPAIRRSGKWVQHGRIPRAGSRLRMTRYRYGGGERGNVAANTIRQLRNPIAGVVSVTNPRPARGGRDVETLETARGRSALELRTRYRAVTAEDFEFLATEASPRIARAVCHDPWRGGMIEVYVLPAVKDPFRLLGPHDLEPDDELLEVVSTDLEKRRLAGARVRVGRVGLQGVTVVADVEAERSMLASDVRRRVEAELLRYLNPFQGGESGDGWPFGEPVLEDDLAALVRRVRGVGQVYSLEMYETDVRHPGKPHPRPAGERIELMPHELACSGAHRVRARHGDGN